MLVDTLTAIKNQLDKDVDHYLMDQLRDNIICAIELMSKLLLTQKNISLFKFKDALFLIYQCKCELEALEHKFASLEDDMTDPLQYSLFRYFKTFLSVLTAKACFYFRNGLFSRGENDIQNVRPELDYHGMVTNFVEKSKCYNVSVVVHMSQKAATGTLSWPRVYSFPEESQPDTHWPNVISLIQQNKKFLSNFRNPPYFIYDTKVNSTYFIAKADRTVFVVVIFVGTVSPQDPVVIHFFEQLISGLRNWRVLELKKK